MSQPLFSIIIPTFNSAKTLSACLDSIISQSFHNVEILIIDGCSKDNTKNIIQHYATLAESQIIWLSEKDKGIYDAMNKGIQLAKGEWLYFLGSDDKLISEDVLFRIDESIKTSKTLDVIYGDVFCNRSNCIYDGEFSYDKIFVKNICHQAIFINKRVFQKIGNFNLKYNIRADWDHNVRWFQSENITKKYVNIVCAEYADGGYSTQNNSDPFLEEIRWKYFLYDRSKFTWGYRYLVVKLEIIKSISKLEFSKLFYIIIHLPSFFIKKST